MKKSSQDLDIFDLRDVALIIGVEDYTVKNWTFGKPFSIEPSIRIGSRTFYDIYDVLTLAIANEMKELNLGFDLLKKVVPLFRDKIEKESSKPRQNYESFDWLIVTLNKGTPGIELNRAGTDRNIELYSYRSNDAVFLVNFARVVASIKTRRMNLDTLREEKGKE